MQYLQKTIIYWDNILLKAVQILKLFLKIVLKKVNINYIILLFVYNTYNILIKIQSKFNIQIT